MKYLVFIGFIYFLPFQTEAQLTHQLLREADKAYEEGAFQEAEINYRKSLEKKQSLQSVYNLGNTLYQQKRNEEAINQYEQASQVATKKQLKASALHNLGNAQLKTGQIQEAIDAYKKAIQLNPHDLTTRYNMAQAQYLLQQTQEQSSKKQEESEPDKTQDQNKDNRQPQEDQPNQEQADENSGQNDEQNSGNNENNKAEPPQGPSKDQQQIQKLSRQEAERLLQIMTDEEQKVLQKMRARSTQKTKPEKDW